MTESAEYYPKTPESAQVAELAEDGLPISPKAGSSSTPSWEPLAPSDHNRAILGLEYVYPVVSRRAGGVSLGVNLNTNNACNWACVYCQVPELRRGVAPREFDLTRLEQELNQTLTEVLLGDFMQRWVPVGFRELRDVAFSGNGEPTLAPGFAAAVAVVLRVLGHWRLLDQVKIVVITNGSGIPRASVQAALTSLGARSAGTCACGTSGIAAEVSGVMAEVWFKVDRATSADIRRINQVNLVPETVLRRLELCARICPTWVQTCMVNWDGQPPTEAEVEAYLDFLRRALERAIPLRGVLLYSLARASHQPQASRIGPVTTPWLEGLAARIRAMGLNVLATP